MKIAYPVHLFKKYIGGNPMKIVIDFANSIAGVNSSKLSLTRC